MRRNLSLATILAISAISNVSRADLILTSSDAWNGTAPTGSAPYLVASFVDGANHTVTLTLSAQHLSTNSGNLESVQDWLFNLDPALSPAGLKFSLVNQVGLFTDPTINATVQNGQTTQANVPFDIDFAFATGNPKNRFTQGDSITYTITDPSDPSFSSAAFDFTTLNNGSGPTPLFSSAHIQNTGLSGQASGDVAAVPEPACLGTLGFVAAGFVPRRRI